MANFDPKVLAIVKRLQTARIEMMKTQPFYALLLMHLKFALDVSCETAYTDGERIAFNPAFLNELDDRELQFVLMHEVLHVVLQHCFRHQSDYEAEAFDIACDIVVNSNIMHSFGDDVKRITMRKYGEMMHQTPDKQEGYLFSAEEVYELVRVWLQQMGKGKKKKDDKDGGEDDVDGADADGDFDGDDSSDGDCDPDDSDDEEEEDPDDNSEEEEDGSEPDESSGAGAKASRKDKKGKGGDKGREDGGEGQGQGKGEKSDAGQGKGGPAYGVGNNTGQGQNSPPEKTEQEPLPEKTVPGQFDDHTFWEGDDEEHTQRTTWMNRMIDATQIVNVLQGSADCGSVPEGVMREIDRLTQSQLDWKTILNDFIQEEINDYSFSPPDRRFDDSPFFLPDYNEKDEHAEDILFMIDTSASMSDSMIAQAYSEIKGAIDQFNGKLKGWLGFFDALVVPPIPFADEEEFKVIRPFGGGGTSFQCVLDYVREEMQDKPPACIIYLTDGFAPWPDEKDAMDIPVLWLINNEQAEPPWGKVARIPPEQR